MQRATLRARQADAQVGGRWDGWRGSCLMGGAAAALFIHFPPAALQNEPRCLHCYSPTKGLPHCTLLSLAPCLAGPAGCGAPAADAVHPRLPRAHTAGEIAEEYRIGTMSATLVARMPHSMLACFAIAKGCWWQRVPS